MNRLKQITNLWRYLLFCLLPALSFADTEQQHEQAVISIIIDDMGYRLQAGERAVQLPGAITYSFLPHAPFAKKLAEQAHARQKEIMLHIPMQSDEGKKLGPGGLTDDLTRQQFNEILRESIASIPFIAGFNNHMGSHLTKNEAWMKHLMREVAMNYNLYFVDSKTTSESVAMAMANQMGLLHSQRDVFIDHDLDQASINKQLARLIKRAKQKGSALAIAHPNKETLNLLEVWLPTLTQHNIKLVPVSELISIQQQRRLALWQKSSSR